MINTILLVHEKDIVSPEQIFNRELKIFWLYMDSEVLR